MPTTIPINHSLAVLRWSVAGDPEEQLCTLGIFADPADTASEQAEKVYDAAIATGSLTPVAAMNNPWTFVGVTVYKRLAGDPVVGEHVAPITQVAGTQTSLPTNCAALMKKITARPGRKGRGRCFLPTALIDEGSVDTNGAIESSIHAFMQGRLNVFYGELDTALIVPTLFHSDGSDGDTITSFSLDPKIATQRQRMRR